jgi:CubicO group peptidase (beta-lactamase class C family)
MRTLIPLLLTACTTIPVGERVELPDGDVPIDHGVVLDDTFADEVDALMVPILEADGINLAIALVKGDQVVFTGAYGWADVARGSEMTVDTPMSMASVSKTFIGIAAMQGVEAGTLSLDDSIAELVGFPVDNPRVEGETISLRHLLTHNSGLEDSREYDRSYDVGDPTISLGEFTRGYVTPNGAYYRTGNFSKRAPNEAFSYSNVGAGLAALGVATPSEREFTDVVKQDILEPLGMTNSGYFLTDLTVAPALQYDSKKRPYEPYGYPTYPDGMMRSTANDMGRYIAMVQGNGTFDGVTVLMPASVEEMLTVDPDLGTDEEGQAVVWAQLGSSDGRTVLGHTGGDFGTFAILRLDRDTGAGLILMINAESTDYDIALTTLRPLAGLIDDFEFPE